MKRIVVCFILLCSLASLTACGGNAEDGTSGVAQETEAVATLEVPKEPEQTWFERSGLSFTPTGKFAFLTHFTDVEQPMEDNSDISIRSKDNGDGTKTIQAIVDLLEPPRIDGELQVGWINCGFVDQFTGTAVVSVSMAPKTFTVDWKGRTYPLTLQKTGAQYPLIEDDQLVSKGYKVYSLTCPSDYDGAAFFVCGSSADIERHLVYNRTKPLEMVDHDDYDLLIFDGNVASGKSEETKENASQLPSGGGQSAGTFREFYCWSGIIRGGHGFGRTVETGKQPI